MKLETVIKLFELLAETDDPWPSKELKEAAKLGIEALSAWISSRDSYGIHLFPLLPGETEG